MTAWMRGPLASHACPPCNALPCRGPLASHAGPPCHALPCRRLPPAAAWDQVPPHWALLQPLGAATRVAMPLHQCGFVASAPGQGEPSCSKDISSPTPVEVTGPGGPPLAVPFGGGWGFALAATDDGTVFAWGVNQVGTCEQEPSGCQSIPEADQCIVCCAQATILQKAGSADDGADPSVLDRVAGGVTAAAAGFDHALVVQGGKVFIFGPAFKGSMAADGGPHLEPVAIPVPVVQVAAGEHHSLALGSNGDVYAWGANREGQLGTGSTTDSTAPVLVLGPSSKHREATLSRPFTAIAAGARHSVAVNDQGAVVAWGWNLHGQCGTGKSQPTVTTPTVVGALGPLKAVSVAAGLGHTVIASDQGDVYAWGLNADSQLGNSSTVAALEVRCWLGWLGAWLGLGGDVLPLVVHAA